MSMSIAACVVLYNVSYSESRSCRYLMDAYLNRTIDELIVVDNSVFESLRKVNCQELNQSLTYIDMHGNKGLSKAYNVALKDTRCDYICFFDDDTVISPSYFQTVKAHIENQVFDIAFPIVMADSIMLSPSRIWKGKSFNYRVRFGCLSAINSCICLYVPFARNLMYDEEFFLDMVDHDFMARASSKGASVLFLKEVTCRQDYSEQTNNLSSSLSRWKIKSKDMLVYGRKHNCTFVMRSLVIKNAIILSLKFKSLQFLSTLF